MHIFSKNFIAVSLINFCVMVAYYLLFIISIPYATTYFAATPSTAGFVTGVMVLGCLAGRFVTGRIIELVGFKKVLLVGVLLYMVSIIAYLYAHTLLLLIVIRFVSGIAVGIIGTVTGTVVAHIVPPRQLGQGISYFSLSTILALAFGPFLGIVLMRSVSYHSIFLLCLGIGALSLCAALPLTVPAPESGPAPDRQAARPACSLNNFIDARVIPVATVVLIAALCYANVQAFISSYAVEAGLSGAASIFFLVYAAVVLGSRPMTGKMFDHYGEHIIIYPSLLLTACGLLLLSQATADWTLLLAGALLGAGFGNFQSTAQAVAVKLVPRCRFGQATSTFYVFYDFGFGFGPYVLGLIVPSVGYRGLYLITAGITLLTLPLYYHLHGAKSHTRPAPPA